VDKSFFVLDASVLIGHLNHIRRAKKLLLPDALIAAVLSNKFGD
jgi:hypothetical protein